MVFGKSVVLDISKSWKVGPVTTHVSDCSDCDSRMAYIPAKKHENGSERPIFDGTHSLYPRIVDPSRSREYSPVNGQLQSNPVGFIPEVTETYALWENFYPLINEHGLGFGESTTEGKPILANAMKGQPDPKFPGKNGTAIFTISPLMSIAMERCKTARCAIETMGTIAQSGGFTGEEYATAEAVTIVDREGEAWVFEIVGDGNYDKPGALWVAQRVPDDHVAIVANNMIIGEIDLEDPDNFMFSDNLIERTKELGIYVGRGNIFNWSRSVGVEIPLPQYSAMRTWRIFSQLAPSQIQEYVPEPGAYPFSVKVEREITVEDVLNLHRDHYQGTDLFDMTQGVMAGPWSSPNLEMGSTPGIVGGYPRAISILRSSYTTVATPLDHHPKIYFAVDQPMTSVFVPFYVEALEVGDFHESFGNPYGPAQQVFNRTTAWWAFDFVSNWMNLNYKNMSMEEVYPARDELQKWVFNEMHIIENNADIQPSRAGEFLSRGQKMIQDHVTKQWWELADTLIVRYNDGSYNFGKYHPDKVLGIQYPLEWLRMVGYSSDFYAPARHWLAPAGMEARMVANSQSLTTEWKPVNEASSLRHLFSLVLATVLSLPIGFLLGVRVERRKRQLDESYQSNAYHKL
jgi:dipeptidase